jgi:hypothetical protein
VFTPEELTARLPVLIQCPTSEIVILRFDPFDFKVPDSEESIEIHRGATFKFEDVLHFWVKSVQSQDWSYKAEYFLPYAQGGKYLMLSEGEFNNLVSQYALDLKQPPSLPLHSESRFIGALQMYDDWNDVAAVAAYENEYIGFYWSTTA